MSENTIKIEVPKELLDKAVADQVEAALAAKGLVGDIRDKKVGDLEDAEKYTAAEQVWRNNGWLDPEKRFEYEPEDRYKEATSFKELVDFLSPDKAQIFFPKLITTMVREAVEPVLVLTNLFRTINYSGETITYPAISNSMFPEDLAPGQEYPEGSLEAAGMVTANIGKVGLAFKISEEVLRYSMFDIASLYFRAAGRALARFKEQKVATLIANEGSTAFNNSDTAVGHGATSGRDQNGDFNGTLTLDDLFVCYADLINQGFLPNTLLMNALGWLIFARSAELRAFGFANGGPMWQPMQGAPGQRPTFASGGVNLGPSAGNPLSGTSPQSNPTASTFANVPTMFPAPLSIVVSPFIRFDNTGQRTDVIMCDRNELGVLIQDETPQSESWDRPERDIRYTKIRERYGLALDNEGEAVVQIKNLKLDKAYDWNERLQWTSGTGTLPSGTGSV